jgi:rubrerythrin
VDEICGRPAQEACGVPDGVDRIVTSRRRVLARGAALGTGLLAGGALLGSRSRPAGAVPSQTQDQKIFNFALLLEYLQAAFYRDALRRGHLRGEVREFAEVVADHEREHVQYLKKALGSNARKKPSFDFGTATRDQRGFLAAAVLLENIGVAAYNGQAANLTKNALAAAAEIVSVEGRHAAWISDLAGEDPAPRAADPGASADEVVARLRRTGFIKGA